MNDIINIFNDFTNKKVLIIGDAMIDSYMWGEVSRMSPEAPVPIININKYENRLGGAANVALNIKKMGSTAILCSVLGNKNNSIIFKKLMKQAELSIEGLQFSDSRKTTVKTRVIANNKHQLRIDEEKIEPLENENDFLSLIENKIKKIDVIILQDYNKGILSFNIINKIISLANKCSIPTIVDPKKENFLNYNNCTVFKPNLSEIKNGMHVKLNNDNLEKIDKVTEQLRDKISAKAILLTMSEKGLFIKTGDKSVHIKAFKRNIIDVSGAGDTVLAVAALCLASKLDYKILAELSCLAGGIVCESVGVMPIEKNLLLNESLKHLKL